MGALFDGVLVKGTLVKGALVEGDLVQGVKMTQGPSLSFLGDCEDDTKGKV